MPSHTKKERAKKKKSFVERLSKRTKNFGDQNKQGPAKESRKLINKQLGPEAARRRSEVKTLSKLTGKAQAKKAREFLKAANKRKT